MELTRLFTNVLDIDNISLMNAEEVDSKDLKEMLLPGLSEEARSPLFVGPSEVDGELLVILPFSFTKSMTWELTHLLVKANHPPSPNSFPPRSVAIIPNATNVTFSDFDDAPAVEVALEDRGGGAYLVPLEQFRSRGLFRRVTALALRFSVAAAAASPALEPASAGAGGTDPEPQVFFNDLALFGVPGERASSGPYRGSMWDDRANLIVSPVLNKRRWGEEAASAGDEEEAEEA